MLLLKNFSTFPNLASSNRYTENADWDLSDVIPSSLYANYKQVTGV